MYLTPQRGVTPLPPRQPPPASLCASSPTRLPRGPRWPGWPFRWHLHGAGGMGGAESWPAPHGAGLRQDKGPKPGPRSSPGSGKPLWPEPRGQAPSLRGHDPAGPRLLPGLGLLLLQRRGHTWAARRPGAPRPIWLQPDAGWRGAPTSARKERGCRQRYREHRPRQTPHTHTHVHTRIRSHARTRARTRTTVTCRGQVLALCVQQRTAQTAARTPHPTQCWAVRAGELGSARPRLVGLDAESRHMNRPGSSAE